MEVTPCPQDVGHYAASLLNYLNLQREQGQFCDCVLKLRQNTHQIYPAHRCVLAASSPVLGSILSSTGVLVELQDPCLSDYVLASLLNYIYNGVLPWPLSQQQYYRLFTAACHLQMKELQEALTAARRQMSTEGKDGASNGAEIPPYECINNTYETDLETSDDPPLSQNTEPCRRLEEVATRFSSIAETFDAEQKDPASSNSSGEDGEKPPGTNDLHYFRTRDESTFKSLHTFHVLENTDRYGSSDERTSLVQRNLMLNNHVTSEVCDVRGVKQETNEYHHHSEGFVRPESWQRSTEENVEGTSKDRRRSSSSSSTSPHPCWGAVPVICHSGRAAGLQPAETCEVSPSSVSSSMTPISRSSSTDSDNALEGMAAKIKDQDEVPSENHTGRTVYPEENNDCRSNTDHFIGNNKTYSTDHNNDDSSQTNTIPLNDDLLPQNQDWRRCLKHRLEGDSDHFLFKHKRLDCFGCNGVSVTSETEKQSKDWGLAVPLPVQDSATGSESHCEDCLEVEAKEEHGSFSRLPAETDRQESPCNPFGSEINWCPNISGAERNKKETISIQQTYKSNSSGSPSTSSESGPDNVTRTLSVFKKCPETTEPYLSPMTGGAICQPYSGHLHYQWLPHQDTHVSLQDSDRKHSQASGFAHNSEDSSDEEKVGSLASSGQRPLMQLLSTENTEQIVLLDINTRPGELLVTCKHRSETEETRVTVRDTGTIRNSGQHKMSAAQKVAVMEASSPKEGEVRGRTRSVCSPVPHSVETPMFSTTSLPANMATDRSAPLFSPSHQTFQCSLCDRSFSQRGSLNRHMRSHLGVRPFPCPCCPMTFSRQYRVTEHMRVHQRCTLGNGLQKAQDCFLKGNEEKSQN